MVHDGKTAAQVRRPVLAADTQGGLHAVWQRAGAGKLLPVIWTEGSSTAYRVVYYYVDTTVSI